MFFSSTLYISEKAQMFALVLIVLLHHYYALCNMFSCKCTQYSCCAWIHRQWALINSVYQYTILQRVNVTLIDAVTLYTVYPLSVGAGHSHKPIAFSIMATSICSHIHAALPHLVVHSNCANLLIHIREPPLVSSIKRGISIFQLVCRAHLKSLGHKMPYFSTGYASRW